jgi:subtilisin family serine protease
MWLNMKETEAIARSINHCINELRSRSPNPLDVGVMSISLGTPNGVHVALRQALVKARKNGLIVIAAAGQAVRNRVIRPLFPANDSNVICVGACGIDDSELHNGFYGQEIDISAPGAGIENDPAKRKGVWMAECLPVSVKRSEGTSYATAITAGACALWQARHGRDTLIQDFGKENLFALFKHCLQTSAFVPNGWDRNNRGAGILDVKALLDFPLPDRAFVESIP